uniref:Uncharacterized protein n=1 Tax=Timema douglasi TaxID=61478 RepID=A0A7R8ZAU9_TIMDO|nr:unnamed protein product [Timema douglasi]
MECQAHLICEAITVIYRLAMKANVLAGVRLCTEQFVITWRQKFLPRHQREHGTRSSPDGSVVKSVTTKQLTEYYGRCTSCTLAMLPVNQVECVQAFASNVDHQPSSDTLSDASINSSIQCIVTGHKTWTMREETGVGIHARKRFELISSGKRKIRADLDHVKGVTAFAREVVSNTCLFTMVPPGEQEVVSNTCLFTMAPPGEQEVVSNTCLFTMVPPGEQEVVSNTCLFTMVPPRNVSEEDYLAVYLKEMPED